MALGLFIHLGLYCNSYLGMVRLGFHSEAQEFLGQFKSDHIEQYEEELHQLCRLTTQEQYQSADLMKTNPFV
jgi:hypothetical protein